MHRSLKKPWTMASSKVDGYGERGIEAAQPPSKATE
jgi:hypothetical protein